MGFSLVNDYQLIHFFDNNFNSRLIAINKINFFQPLSTQLYNINRVHYNWNDRSHHMQLLQSYKLQSVGHRLQSTLALFLKSAYSYRPAQLLHELYIFTLLFIIIVDVAICLLSIAALLFVDVVVYFLLIVVTMQ